MWGSYLDYVAQHGERLRKDYPPVVEWEAKRYIKARMAKQLFGEEAYYGVLAQDDPMIEEPMRVLSRSNPLSVLQE